MRLYANQWKEVMSAVPSLRVYSDRVKPGHVLRVNGCFFHVPESAAGDPLTIYMQNGGQDIVLRSRAMTTNLDGMSIFNPFDMGEGDRLYGYAANAIVDESLILNIVGILYSLEEWRTLNKT